MQLSAPVDALLSALTPVLGEALAEGTHELYRTLLLARLCLKRMQAHPQEYQALHQSHGKEQSVHLLRLDIAGHLADCTRRMRGSSATGKCFQVWRLPQRCWAAAWS